MKKILLLALIVLVYQGQNKAALPELSIPSTPINHASLPELPILPFSTPINYMIAPLLAFGSGYKVVTTIIDDAKKNKPSSTPFVYLLIGIGGLVFLDQESSYSEHAFYVSTFVLGCFMGELSSKNLDRHILTTQRRHFYIRNALTHIMIKLFYLERQLKQSQDKLNNIQIEFNNTQGLLNDKKEHINKNESDLTLYQNGLTPIVIEPSEQSEEEICTICQCPLPESQDQLEPGSQGKEIVIIELKCGHLSHQECINKWLAQRTSCPACRTCFIETSGKIITPPHRVLNQDHESTL